MIDKKTGIAAPKLNLFPIQGKNIELSISADRIRRKLCKHVKIKRRSPSDHNRETPLIAGLAICGADRTKIEIFRGGFIESDKPEIDPFCKNLSK